MYRKIITTLFSLVLLAMPSIVSAARLDTIGMETASTSPNVEFTLNGIFSAAADGATTTKAHSGLYSLKFNEQGAAQFSWMAYKYRASATAASTTAGAFIYLNTVYSATQEIFTLANEGPGSAYSLRLNASNQLCLFDSVPTQIGSCTAITTGAWHSVDIATNGASTVIGMLDGVEFAQSASATGAAISRVYFGCAFSASCKSDTYYDDMYVNDSTAGGDQTFFASSTRKVLRITPFGAGDKNTFGTQTGGVAGSDKNYGRAGETGPDGATTFNGSPTLNAEDLFKTRLQTTATTTSIYTVSTQWTAPAGVTIVNVDAWGGGGGKGGAASPGAGCGGDYAGLSGFAVTPGNSYVVTVGIGGLQNATGTDSMFSASSTLLAKGGGNGSPGAGSTAACVVHNLGTVGDATSTGGNGGGAAGGGGGAGGSLSNGATGISGGSTGAGGAAGTSIGNGMTGGTGQGSGSNPVNAGVGGGAAGEVVGSQSGNGMVVITYQTDVGATDQVELVEYHNWIRASAAGTNSVLKPEIEKIAAGTISQGTAVTPAVVSFMSNTTANPNLPGLTLYTNPDGVVWTATTLQSLQLGYKITTGNTNRVDVSSAWAYVEYVPSSVVPPVVTIVWGDIVFVRSHLFFVKAGTMIVHAR